MKQEDTNARIRWEPGSEYLESIGKNKALSSQNTSTLFHVTLTMMALLVIKLLIVLVFMAIMNNLTFSNFQKCMADKRDINSTLSILQRKSEDLQSKYSKLERWAKRIFQSCDQFGISKGGNYHICPAGWLMKDASCYFVSSQKMSWNSAQEDCISRQSNLLVINSESEQIFMSNTLSSENFWMGLNDIASESNFMWVDGSPLDSSIQFWAYKQPDNYKDAEDCATLWLSDNSKNVYSNWNDLICNTHIKYICEKEAYNLLSIMGCGSLPL
ncbi:C-type lectin domain family 4 member E-like isoform X2 [Bombina bombina]|uniref:C-type lectin domain family 4 member E-like isoform X2 n=1 Tax=Bombina bombina TaxID=8345 RepID=UPI00235ABF0A|nr:C-type lectin domain family 4 member E-like isoform X2 [Bombina bombina]